MNKDAREFASKLAVHIKLKVERTDSNRGMHALADYVQWLEYRAEYYRRAFKLATNAFIGAIVIYLLALCAIIFYT